MNTVASLPAKLLPCPFCGSASIDEKGWVSENSAGPACDDCGASAGCVSSNLADNIAAWNRRASPAPSAGVGLDPPVEHQRDMLAQAIRDAAVKAGIAHADASMTGPMLLMLCDDLADAALQHPAAPSALPEGVYYSAEHDNFYRRIDGAGMGTPFYNKWRPVAADFPQA